MAADRTFPHLEAELITTIEEAQEASREHEHNTRLDWEKEAHIYTVNGDSVTADDTRDIESLRKFWREKIVDPMMLRTPEQQEKALAFIERYFNQIGLFNIIETQNSGLISSSIADTGTFEIRGNRAINIRSMRDGSIEIDETYEMTAIGRGLYHDHYSTEDLFLTNNNYDEDKRHHYKATAITKVEWDEGKQDFEARFVRLINVDVQTSIGERVLQGPPYKDLIKEIEEKQQQKIRWKDEAKTEDHAPRQALVRDFEEALRICPIKKVDNCLSQALKILCAGLSNENVPMHVAYTNIRKAITAIPTESSFHIGPFFKAPLEDQTVNTIKEILKKNKPEQAMEALAEVKKQVDALIQVAPRAPSPIRPD